MNKKFILFLSILTLLLVLTACKNKNNNESNQGNIDDNGNQVNNISSNLEGNYSEIELPQPKLDSNESWLGSRINSNNQLEIYTDQCIDDKVDKVYCYTLINDEFQKTSVSWVENACKELGIVTNQICPSEDGNDYFLCTKFINDNEQRKGTPVLVRKSEDSKGYEDITPSYWFDDKPLISEIKITKNQTICYREAGLNELAFYNLTDNQAMDYAVHTTISDFVVKGDSLYYIDNDRKTIQIENLETKKSEEIALVSDSENEIMDILFQVMPNDDIILINNSGLYIKKYNGTMWERIVDGDQNSMSMSNYHARSLHYTLGENNTYFVIYHNTIEGQDELYVKYEPSTNQNPTEVKELTVYSLYFNAYMRLAIDQYTRKHKDVNIKYNVIISDKYGATTDDAVRSLNTEILAGKGADILLLDDLPLTSYMEKGILMDLSDLFAEDDQENELLTNITNCYTYDNKLVCVPLKIYMPVYCSHEELTNQTKTIKDLAAYCEGKDNSLMEALDYRKLINLFLSTYYEEIFLPDGQIDKGGLTSFLNSLSIIAKQISAQENLLCGHPKSYDSGYVPEASYRMLSLGMGIPDSLMWENEYLLATTSVGNIWEVNSLIPILTLINGSYQPINQSFIPNGLVGINQSTKNPELSKDFVSFLLDESMQKIDTHDGFPINEKALDSWVKPGESLGNGCYSNESNAPVYFEYDRVTTEDMQKLVDMIKTLDKPIYSDFNGKEMIISGAIEYLNGNQTLDQAVNDIMQKFNLYILE